MHNVAVRFKSLENAANEELDPKQQKASKTRYRLVEWLKVEGLKVSVDARSARAQHPGMHVTFCVSRPSALSAAFGAAGRMESLP